MFKRKALATIAAILGLILIIAFLTISFGVWFSNYASQVGANLEEETEERIARDEIISLVGDDLYIYNDVNKELDLLSVKIDGTECTIPNNANLTLGTNKISLSDCITNDLKGSYVNILVLTNNWIIESRSILIPGRAPALVPFNFIDQTDVAFNQLITSNTVNPTGFEGTLTVNISGEGSPQLRVNSGSWTTTDTISPGDDLTIRLTSSNLYFTPRVATLQIGNYSTDWRVTTESIIPLKGYAWGENIGFISFNGTNYGVNLVENITLEGYAWSENFGYISFNGTNYGVNLINGVVNGHAWSENFGYISFNGTNYQTINNNSHIRGYAWGENIGFISFNGTNYNVSYY